MNQNFAGQLPLPYIYQLPLPYVYQRLTWLYVLLIYKIFSLLEIP